MVSPFFMNAPRTEIIVRKRGEIRDHELYELARELEDDNARLRAALNDEGYANEIWALSQRLPNEGALDAIDRIHTFLSALANAGGVPRAEKKD